MILLEIIYTLVWNKWCPDNELCQQTDMQPFRMIFGALPDGCERFKIVIQTDPAPDAAKLSSMMHADGKNSMQYCWVYKGKSRQGQLTYMLSVALHEKHPNHREEPLYVRAVPMDNVTASQFAEQMNQPTQVNYSPVIEPDLLIPADVVERLANTDIDPNTYMGRPVIVDGAVEDVVVEFDEFGFPK